MKTIRYDEIVIDDNLGGILKIGYCNNMKEIDISKLGDKMIALSDKWEIISLDIFKYAKPLLYLVKYVKEKNSDINICLNAGVNYFILKSISTTDEILDFCDSYIES